MEIGYNDYMNLYQLYHPRRWAEHLCHNAERVAQHRGVYGIVLIVELTGCTFLPLPVTLIMVTLVAAAPQRWTRLALSATVGSIAGGIALYIVGHMFFHAAGERLIHWYGMEAYWARALEWFHGGWGAALILLAGATTGLFRVATMAAGFMAMSPTVFILTLSLSRFIRWLAECGAIKYLRGHIPRWPRRYFRYGIIGVVGVLLLAMLLVFIWLQ